MAAVFFFASRDGINQIGFTIMAAVYMFVPLLSVIIVKKFHREPVFGNLLISFKVNRWFFVSWLIFPVIVFCSVGISVLLPGLSYNPQMTGFLGRVENLIPPEASEEFSNRINSLPINFLLLSVIQGLFAGITVNAIAGFGEEIGWRGFLFKEFKDMHFLKAALVIGSVWGIWHAPLILMGHNYPQHTQIGVLMMTVYCILLTPLLQYLTIKSRSVISAAIAHGTHNAVFGISIIATSGGNDLTSGMTGIPGFITLLIFNLLLFIYDCFVSKEKILLSKISAYI